MPVEPSVSYPQTPKASVLRRPLPTPILGWVLVCLGVILALVAHFLNPLSYVGLEVPGSGFYVAALAIVLFVSGFALAGTTDHPA